MIYQHSRTFLAAPPMNPHSPPAGAPPVVPINLLVFFTVGAVGLTGCPGLPGRTFGYYTYSPAHAIAAADGPRIRDFPSLVPGGWLKLSVKPNIDAENPNHFQLGMLVNLTRHHSNADMVSIERVRYRELPRQESEADSGSAPEAWSDALAEPVRISINPSNRLGDSEFMDTPLPYPPPSAQKGLAVEVDVLIHRGDAADRETVRGELFPFKAEYPAPLH